MVMKKAMARSRWNIKVILGEIIATMVLVNVLAFGLRLVLDLINAKNTMANVVGFNIGLFMLLVGGYAGWWLVNTLIKQLGMGHQEENQ